MERIDIIDSDKIVNSQNNETNLHIERKSLLENHYLQNNENTFAFHLSHAKEIIPIFDIHKTDDFDEWGRIYSIYFEKGCIIVEFKKEDDNRNEIYKFFVAIKTGNNHFDKIEEFTETNYKYDEFRNSQSKRYVYSSVKFLSNMFTLSMSKNKKNAIKNATYLFNNYNIIKKNDNRNHSTSKLVTAPKYVTDSYKEVNSSMNKLIFFDNKKTKNIFKNSLSNKNKDKSKENQKDNFGIYAGYPWFFQTWSRDELICINYLINKNEYSNAKKIFMKYLSHKSYCGRLPAIVPEQGNKSADGLGWLAFRFSQFIKQLKKERKFTKFFSKYELLKISEFFERQAYLLKKYHLRNGLIYSGKDETWMDTSYEDNGREGFCIEIQALAIKIFELTYELTGKDRFRINAEELKENTIKSFYDKKTLYDYLDADLKPQKNARPNFFIAYYVCPELLTKIMWEKVFDDLIPKLWLNWGGFSSIDTKSKNFVNEYTGENNMSYHRGDSWYFLNCIAGICLLKQHKTKYKKYIEKIIKACCDECLSNGVYGAIAEISSAKSLTGYGCLSQAWSNSMFVELIEDYYYKEYKKIIANYKNIV